MWGEADFVAADVLFSSVTSWQVSSEMQPLENFYPETGMAW